MAADLPNNKILDTDPEIKSFIYQQISEFQPFVTPQTIVAVIAKDPRKLRRKMELEGLDVPKNLAKMYRISIVLREGDTKIHEEALHENVFEAIRSAKQKLLEKLGEIHNQVVTESERVEQINTVMQNDQIH